MLFVCFSSSCRLLNTSTDISVLVPTGIKPWVFQLRISVWMIMTYLGENKEPLLVVLPCFLHINSYANQLYEIWNLHVKPQIFISVSQLYKIRKKLVIIQESIVRNSKFLSFLSVCQLCEIRNKPVVTAGINCTKFEIPAISLSSPIVRNS